MAFHDAVMGVIRAVRPTFRNPLDKMAFAVHASFIASGYILLATGPDALAVLDPMNSQQRLTEVGIDGWDALDDNYAFIYSHRSNNPKRVFIRCVPVDAINEYLFVEAQSHRRSCWPFSVNILIRAFNDNYGRRNNYASQYRNFNKLVHLIYEMLLAQVNLHPSDPPSNQLSSCLYHPLVPVIPVYWQPQTGTGVFHPSHPSVNGIDRGRFEGSHDAKLNWVMAHNNYLSAYQHFVMTYQFLVMANQDWVNSECSHHHRGGRGRGGRGRGGRGRGGRGRGHERVLALN